MAAFGISEYDIELATLRWLEGIGWQVASAPTSPPTRLALSATTLGRWFWSGR